QALNVPAAAIPPDPQARAALLRSSLTGRRVLLVLDNARDEEQVRPLLPGTGGRVLITSRNRLPGLAARDDAIRIDLNGLDTAQAVDLLGREPVDPDTARTLIELCGHLPLPLRVIGERLDQDDRSLSEVLEELRAVGLDAFPDQDRASDLRAVFSWSYRALPEDAARMFRLLGAYPGQEISIEAAAALAGLTPHRVRRQLDRLTGVSLLQQRADRRYRFHDLLGTYAAELSEQDSSESTAARQRLQEWFLHVALDAEKAAPEPDIAHAPVPRPDGLVFPVFHDTADRIHWFDVEQLALVAVINQAAAAGEHEFVCRLSRPLLRMLWLRHRWTDQIAVSHLARASAGRTGDTRAEFLAVQSLGNAACDTRNLPEAFRWHTELLGIAERMDSLIHEMMAWASVGVDHAVAEDFDDAAQAFGRAIELSQELNNPRLTARYSGNLAYVYNNVGEHEQALPVAQEAVRVLRELENQRDLAEALMTVGTALTGLGRTGEAIDVLRESVALFGPHSSQQLLAGAHTGLAEALLAAGRREEALAAWREALDIAIRIGDPDIEMIRQTIVEHEA
ncbi:MAG TPA: tetratricopeptide repeat protein, partial [Mycobacteriales bacterium]|nr:tetratricopeptide repeat protein [Mycobacteriales bacterium]